MKTALKLCDNIVVVIQQETGIPIGISYWLWPNANNAVNRINQNVEPPTSEQLGNLADGEGLIEFVTRHEKERNRSAGGVGAARRPESRPKSRRTKAGATRERT